MAISRERLYSPEIWYDYGKGCWLCIDIAYGPFTMERLQEWLASELQQKRMEAGAEIRIKLWKGWKGE